MYKNVATVIVSYNRKTELVRCVEAVLKQSYLATSVIIVDNASTDGTTEYLIGNGYLNDKEYPYDQLIEGLKKGATTLYLLRKSRNTGGSGGFSSGMQAVSGQIAFDYLWMMDDDGYPSEDCLKDLCRLIDQYDYVMPTSIDINNHEQLSWPVKMKNGKHTIRYKELCKVQGDILDYVTPFNGILLSKKIVDDVGYINPDFFIWGDEYDHYHRCKQKGYTPLTYLPALFFHPAQKLPHIPILFGLMKVPYVESKLRMVCLARNYTYIYRHYGQWYKIPLKFMQYTWLFLITKKWDFEGFSLYCKSVKDGFREDFTRHLQYLK